MKCTAAFILTVMFVFGSAAIPRPPIAKTEVAIIGILCKEDVGSPVTDGFVAVTGAENLYSDRTNAEGIYCVYIPQQGRNFTLSYKAGGFWGKFSRPQKSDRDTIKMDRACLDKKKPNELGEMGAIEDLIATEYRMYVASTSPKFRKLLRNELREYHDAI